MIIQFQTPILFSISIQFANAHDEYYKGKRVVKTARYQSTTRRTMVLSESNRANITLHIRKIHTVPDKSIPTPLETKQHF